MERLLKGTDRGVPSARVTPNHRQNKTPPKSDPPYRSLGNRTRNSMDGDVYVSRGVSILYRVFAVADLYTY